jgi:hypothetical protein
VRLAPDSGDRQLVTALRTAEIRRPATALTDESLGRSSSALAELVHRVETAEARARHLRRALERSRDIGAAVGVLMALHKVTQDDAFEMLRRSSQHHDRKVHAVAREVISTGTLPEA